MGKVLILEDAQIGGDTLQALRDRGLEGSWFIGVKSVNNSTLTGIRPDFSEEVVQLSHYALAFVDGFLYICGQMGWDVLPFVKPLMHTVGTSSIGEIGCHESIDKGDMVKELDRILGEQAQTC
ncbi:MAG: hypothetical protein K2X27_20655 [Candidatus Obscuribacterales bacterium]|nr:hypothetical protein [Candidatus Obscuribacterales bacterium]